MDLIELVHTAGRRWGADTRDWSVLVAGTNPVVRFPRAGAVLHVSRPGVGGVRVAALQRARAELAARDIPVAQLLASRAGSTWEEVDGRVLEVERWLEHDGRMNTWDTLLAGVVVLARVHHAWQGLDLGPEAEGCDWANWISPVDVVDRCHRAARRLTRWGEGELAESVVRLAEATSQEVPLPSQLVHGDFWDDNVYLRGQQIVAVTDFDFLGRRPRIDDLALLLYFADEQPYFSGSGFRDAATRRGQLAPLVHRYARSLTTALTSTELEALPLALARQPLWTYGRWVVTDPDDEHARRMALDTAPGVSRALEITAQPDVWVEAFSQGAHRVEPSPPALS